MSHRACRAPALERALGFLALAAALLAAEGVASAAVVVVDDFKGAKKNALREAVTGALEKADHEVVESSAARVRASSADSVYVKHATEYHAAAFVDGVVTQKKSGWSLKLTVRNGEDGRVLGDTTLKGSRLNRLLRKIDAEAALDLAPLLDQASSPETRKEQEEAAPEGAETTPPEHPNEQASEETRTEPRDEPREPTPAEKDARPVPLELWGGMQAFSRSFEYHQDVNGTLHPYHLSLWPALEARLGYYPGAHFTRNMAANIGVIAGIARSFGAESAIGGSKSFGTTMQELFAGARFRLPLGRHELGVSFLYGNHGFSIDSDHDPATRAANGLPIDRNYVPDAAYSYLRPGLDGRLQFGRLRFGAGLGYRVILGLGELGSAAWFPHATAKALDGFVSAGYELSPGLYVTAGFDATRYALDMHTTPADRAAARDFAGGAIDEYLTGRLGVEYRFGQSRANSPEWRVSRRELHGGNE